MGHLAIDLGSRESQLCIRGQAGKIVRERKVRTAYVRENRIDLRHHRIGR
jgi:hypothetical protein